MTGSDRNLFGTVLCGSGCVWSGSVWSDIFYCCVIYVCGELVGWEFLYVLRLGSPPWAHSLLPGWGGGGEEGLGRYQPQLYIAPVCLCLTCHRTVKGVGVFVLFLHRCINHPSVSPLTIYNLPLIIFFLSFLLFSPLSLCLTVSVCVLVRTSSSGQLQYPGVLGSSWWERWAGRRERD